MSGPTGVTNPNGAFVAVTDYRLFRDSSGAELQLGKGDQYVARANATVLAGQALEHVVPTSTVPYSVQPMQVASGIVLYAGVALNGASAGGDVWFTRNGYVIAFTDDSDTPAFGSVVLKPDATAGQFAVASAAATSTGQAVLGTCLGAEEGGAALRKSPMFLSGVAGTTNPLT